MPRSEFDVGHIRLGARRRSDRGGAGDRRPDGQDGAAALPTISPPPMLLATDKPMLLAPAMNPRMWNNAATQRNVAQLERRWRRLHRPECRRDGRGRRSRRRPHGGADWRSRPPPRRCCGRRSRARCAGKRVLITAGPTHEPIDPVRYIANRSSGKQGYAIAAAAAAAGADVTLVSGPVDLADPAGRHRDQRVETAREMLAAVEAALPADVAIFAAAVADWRVANAGEQKIKKDAAGMPPLSAGGKPRHPRHDRTARRQAAAAGDRLCRRDRERRSTTPRPNSRARAATGSSPTTCRRRPA